MTKYEHLNLTYGEVRYLRPKFECLEPSRAVRRINIRDAVVEQKWILVGILST